MTQNPKLPPATSTRPTVTFETITFSDGKTLDLLEDDVIVFVGPNNAGKSLALRELEDHFSNPPETLVVKSVELRKTGTPEGFAEFLKGEHGNSHTRAVSNYQIPGLYL